MLDHALQELRRLNEPVPRPRRLPTLEEVNELERQVGVRFHPDFRRYLLEASDVVYGTLEPVTAVPRHSPGVQDYTFLPNVIASGRAYGLPEGLLPFCEDNADFYCLNEGGEVLFWSHNGWTDEKWPDLATWIKEVWVGGN